MTGNGQVRFGGGPLEQYPRTEQADAWRTVARTHQEYHDAVQADGVGTPRPRALLPPYLTALRRYRAILARRPTR